MELKDRVMRVVEYSGLSIPRFAAKIGARTPQAIREITYGNTKTLSYEMAQRIVAAFPELNTGWLMTGEGEMLKPKGAANGEPPITTGEGSVLINSGGSRVDTNSGAVIYKALDEIAEQRKLTAKAHEQIDRLLAIIDRLTSGVNNNNQ